MVRQPLERLAAAPARVRDGPVVRRRQAPVAVAPHTHRVQNAFLGPAPLEPAGVAGLAVRVGVALAVARLGVSAAAAAHADVAGLHRPCLLPRGVIEVGLDRRGRAAEALRV